MQGIGVNVPFVLRSLQDESLLLFFKVGPLAGHHDAQQLVLNALRGDHEVEQSHLQRHHVAEVGTAQKFMAINKIMAAAFNKKNQHVYFLTLSCRLSQNWLERTCNNTDF